MFEEIDLHCTVYNVLNYFRKPQIATNNLNLPRINVDVLNVFLSSVAKVFAKAVLVQVQGRCGADM